MPKTKKVEEEQNLLDNLYKIPKKDKGGDMPHIEVTEPNYCHQADLLFLPNDDGYRYSLVVVDCDTGKTDAVALKEKSAKAVLDGFKTIYKRGILKFPQRLEVDPGGEFKGVVKTYFNDGGAFVRYGLPGRHRMQALVERRNRTIGTDLLKRQTAQELLTGEPSVEWIEDLPGEIKKINKHLPEKKEYPDEPTGSKKSFDFLPVGTKVRVMLDEPRDVTSGKRLSGGFRGGDIRWNPKPRVIRQLNLSPGQPPTYLLDGSHGTEKVENVAYTRNQLQVIPENEQLPPTSVIRGKPQHYIVEKIIGMKKIRGKIFYRVKWKGFPEDESTLEPRSRLIEDVPKVVEAYDKLNK
jgi:hypothetical protein